MDVAEAITGTAPVPSWVCLCPHGARDVRYSDVRNKVSTRRKGKALRPTTSVGLWSFLWLAASVPYAEHHIRLWASAGQRSLEQARVLLVGCDAAGSQSLKNLVLPGEPFLPWEVSSVVWLFLGSLGISQFTILSSKTTTAQDVATNFFLHPDSIGSNIAQESVKWVSTLTI